MSHKKHKKKSIIVIWLEFIPFLLFYRLVRIIPLQLAYLISKMIFRLVFSIDRKHRKRSIQHIMHSGIRDNKKTAKRLASDSYNSFSKLPVEIIKSDQ